jgi:hypothetical protein
VIFAGNCVGLGAPIVTRYIIDLTGSYDNAFVIAGLTSLLTLIISQTSTRKHIGSQAPNVAEDKTQSGLVDRDNTSPWSNESLNQTI